MSQTTVRLARQTIEALADIESLFGKLHVVSSNTKQIAKIKELLELANNLQSLILIQK
jgi:hypothetical protein